MGMFTHNHFFHLPASPSPESDSSDSDDDNLLGPRSLADWNVNTPPINPLCANQNYHLPAAQANMTTF